MLSWEYPPHLVGGLGAHVAELVPALAAQGIDLTVITPRWKGGAHQERVNENATVYRIDPPVERMSNYYADAQQTNLVLEEAAHRLWQQGAGFQLVHAHDWLVSFAAEALKKLYKTPLVATMHATERGRGGGELNGHMPKLIDGAEWWLTYEAWRVIAASRFMADEVRAYFRLPTDKIVVIPNGVNPERFTSLEGQDLSGFRSGWAQPDQRLVFFIGRVQQEKGVEGLVEAARQLLQRGENIKFVLAGTGAMERELRARVERMGLQDHVVIPGYISNETRDRMYMAADVAVFPSSYEPFGIVALEAMAAHCPVIVSNVGGLGEVVEDQVTGLKIPPADLDALVNAIADVLAHPDTARARAELAFERVCREYSWNHIARETTELYDWIIRARTVTDWN